MNAAPREMTTRRMDRWSRLAVIAFAAGVLVRVFAEYPVHKYPADADALLLPTRGIQVLHGRLSTFTGATRTGSLESIAHAASFAIFGISRASAAVAPLVSGSLLLVGFYLFVRELVGREIAALALLFLALPPPNFLFWTYMPNGYPEALLLAVTALWLAARIVRRGGSPGALAAWGLCAGLGFWTSAQTLACTLPSLVWMLAGREEIRRRVALLASAAAGFAVGAAPWIWWYARKGGRELWNALRFPDRMAGFLPSVAEVVSSDAGSLSTGAFPGASASLSVARSALHTLTAASLLAGAALLLASLFSERIRSSVRMSRGAVAPLAGIAFAILAYAGFVQSGLPHALPARHLLALWIALAIALGTVVALVERYQRNLGAILAVSISIFFASGWALPWNPLRPAWESAAQEDESLVRFLEGQRVTAAFGDYWTVYPINFVSRERIAGVPTNPTTDTFGYGPALTARSSGWALLARDAAWLRRWAERAGLRGRIVPVAGRLVAFLPDSDGGGSRSPAEVRALLQRTAPAR